LDLAIAGWWWVAAALAAWLTVTTVIYMSARVVPSLRGLRVLDRFAAPFVRRAVDGALACSLGALVTMHVPAAALAPTSTPSTTPPATISVTPDGDIVVAPAQPPEPVAPTPPSRTPAPAPVSPHPRAEHHHIKPGENLWRVAAARLAQVRGRAPRDAEVLPYWRRVIDANRASLRSGDPNLVYPGELVDLPPV